MDKIKQIVLSDKILETTKDAVILHAESGKNDEDFTCARRICYGPEKQMLTSKPYIILFNYKDEKNINDIVKHLLCEFCEDFSDSLEPYCVHIISSGQYFDKRIQWIMV